MLGEVQSKIDIENAPIGRTTRLATGLMRKTGVIDFADVMQTVNQFGVANALALDSGKGFDKLDNALFAKSPPVELPTPVA